jgi:hypothetical protein
MDQIEDLSANTTTLTKANNYFQSSIHKLKKQQKILSKET